MTSPPRPIAKVERSFDVTVTLPGSKSIALRHLVMAALADAPTELVGAPVCDDAATMAAALRVFGVGIKALSPTHWLVKPPSTFAVGELNVDLGLSGVSMRLLLALAALRGDPTRFNGQPPLKARPNGGLIEALRELGCAVEAQAGGRLPITVRGTTSHAAQVAIDASVSGQFLSALLLLAPRLTAGLTIRPSSAPASAPYIAVTVAEMARRGVAVETSDTGTFKVAPQPYRGGAVAIEGDASAATYHAALATLHHSTVRITNLGANTGQGDFAFFNVCRRLGAQVQAQADSVTITGPAALNPLPHVDMASMPDAAPTLMAMAPFLPAPVEISGLATLRHKECDRISCPVGELRKAGVEVEEGADHVRIAPLANPRSAAFDTFDDHRMAMAMAVFASKSGGSAVHAPACVAKTYADFWTDFDRIYA